MFQYVHTLIRTVLLCTVFVRIDMSFDVILSIICLNVMSLNTVNRFCKFALIQGGAWFSFALSVDIALIGGAILIKIFRSCSQQSNLDLCKVSFRSPQTTQIYQEIFRDQRFSKCPPFWKSIKL